VNGGRPPRAVWLGGGLVEPDRAALPIDDPAVRHGDGLFETMRAVGGRVPWLERHLARLRASADVLGIAPLPGPDEMHRAVAAVLEALGAPSARVRLTVTARPTLLVEAIAEAPPAAEPAAARAISVRGAWCPGAAVHEHKTLSYAGHAWAQRRAAAAGADHALLLDAEGRLGEAAIANVLVAVGGEVLTSPARGLLAGVTRAFAIAQLGAREEPVPEMTWRAADEIVATNAVTGVAAVVEVDGRPVGDGRPGPVARRLAAALSREWA